MFTLPVSLADLWPASAVAASRPDDDSAHWLPPGRAWRERASATPLVLAGNLGVLCHEAGATPAGCQLLRDCGLPVAGAVITFRDGAGARAAVARLAAAGHRIGANYAPRHPAAPREAYVNDLEVFATLNDKAALAELLPPGALPSRLVVPQDELAGALARRPHPTPVVLKACTRLGSGAGCDVALCRTPGELQAGIAKLAAADRVLLEEFCRFTSTWCLHFAAGEAGVTWLGAAEQICGEDGSYHGNWWEHGAGPGPEAVELGRLAAIAGWARGYRGYLGVDVGQAPDGRWLAFDANFRTNGSTTQVLLGPGLAEAWGTRATRVLAGVHFQGSLEGMVDRLWTFHRRRELVPIRTFDTSALEPVEEGGAPTCSFVAAGGDRAAVLSVLRRLREAGFDCRDG